MRSNLCSLGSRGITTFFIPQRPSALLLAFLLLLCFHPDCFAQARRSLFSRLTTEGSSLEAGKSFNCTANAEGRLYCSNGLYYEEVEAQVSSPYLIITYCLICSGLVLTAGMMSGLTIGLMGMDLTSLHLIRKAGTPLERKYSAKIIPVVEKHHLLLVTLLLTNAAAMEALPIFLDRLVSAGLAIIISVTLVLLFGEVIPQALCTRYGLAIGANCAWLVKVLMIVLYVIAWPISKVLDMLLGEVHITRYGRSHLRELVRMHENKNEGPLTADEATVIIGALDMINKKVFDVMVPLNEVYMLNENEKMDMAARQAILAKGHSRIPVYKRHRHQVQGLLLVNNLITSNPDDAVPLRELDLDDLPRVRATTPLYDMLNDFLQSPSSHDMALVIDEETQPSSDIHYNSEESKAVVGIIALDDILHELVKEDVEEEEDEGGTSRSREEIELQRKRREQKATTIQQATRRLEFANALRRVSMSLERLPSGVLLQESPDTEDEDDEEDEENNV